MACNLQHNDEIGWMRLFDSFTFAKKNCFNGIGWIRTNFLLQSYRIQPKLRNSIWKSIYCKTPLIFCVLSNLLLNSTNLISNFNQWTAAKQLLFGCFLVASNIILQIYSNECSNSVYDNFYSYFIIFSFWTWMNFCPKDNQH